MRKNKFVLKNINLLPPKALQWPKNGLSYFRHVVMIANACGFFETFEGVDMDRGFPMSRCM
jgi:hypothetical protein